MVTLNDFSDPLRIIQIHINSDYLSALISPPLFHNALPLTCYMYCTAVFNDINSVNIFLDYEKTKNKSV